MNKRLAYIACIAATFIFLFAQCSVYKTLMNVSRLKFKLNGVQNVTVAGISLDGKNKLQDFSIMEIASLTRSLSQGQLRIEFVLNLSAVNPNDGSGGFPRTDATLKSLPYRLVIDNKEILSGNIGSAVAIPGTGEESIIPLSIGFDLIQSFQDNNYQSLINLALNLAGKSSTPSTIALYAKPTVGTVIGDLTYPGELRIIEHEFSDR